MDLKNYAPTRKNVMIFLAIVAAACVASIPLFFIGAVTLIPTSLLLWAAIPFYPLPKALLMAVVWIALLGPMYVAAARIASGNEWKIEVVKCLLAIILVFVIAFFTTLSFNAAYGTSCERDSDCTTYNCGPTVGKNYIDLAGVNERDYPLCGMIEGRTSCIERVCQIDHTTVWKPTQSPP